MKKTLLLASLLLFTLILGCSSQKELGVATEDLKNTRWKLVELNSQKISGLKSDIYIIFNLHNNEFKAFGGCNEIYGLYVYDGKILKLNNIAMTKINCTDGEDKYEYSFVDALKSFDNHKIIQKNLYLYKGNKVIAKFEATFL